MVAGSIRMGSIEAIGPAQAGNAVVPTGDRARFAVGEDEPRSRHALVVCRGFKDILARVCSGISRDRIALIAAGVTFYLLLSIFPGIAALISIYGLFADPAVIADQLGTLASIAPGGAVEVLRDELTRLAANGGTTLGVGFFISLVFSLWTTNSGVAAFFDALNLVHEKEETRGFIKYYLATLSFTVAAVIFALLSIATVVALPVVLNWVPLPGGTDLFVRIARWPILFMLVAFALAALYCYGPSRTAASWRWITWGSAFAVVAWLAVSALFSWYVANFGSYNKTYGSLGAVIGFMTWIWLSVVLILVGAKLNAEIERGTRNDVSRPVT
jgi:membrane protein